MGNHQRATPLLRLLARLGWQRDADLWNVRCCDGRGRRARLCIHLTAAGVTLTPSSPGPWALTPLEAGHLRGAVRDALLSLDRLASAARSGARRRSTEVGPPLPAVIPVPRQRVSLAPLTRPSVAEIVSRVVAPATSSSEVNHGHRIDKLDRHACGTSVAA